MACNANKASFFRAVAKRGFSASVCPRPLGQPAEVNTSVLGNKVVVAAVSESSLPVTRLSVVFRAGSRNETYETLGASHLLRIATGLSTRSSSAFAITRNIQQIGGNLSCTADRETISYTIETTADHVETGLRFLQDVIQPSLKPWELHESLERIRYQVAAVPPQVRAVELLHRAAFRNGLGNSIYIPKHQIGRLSTESLLHYVSSNYTAGRCAVVGVGINANTLSGFAQSLVLDGGEGKSETAVYHGGDARKDTPGHISHVAVAGQGAGLQNQKETLAFAILQHAVGAQAPTKRGNINGTFGKALASAVGNASVSYNVLNANYADTGLFGFVISTDVQHIGKAVDAVAKALKSGTVSADDVNRGKALLKAAVLETYGNDSLLVSELGLQALLTKQVLSADAIVSAIDGISHKDVQDAARKAGSSKLSVGAVGNLANVPYASDLA